MIAQLIGTFINSEWVYDNVDYNRLEFYKVPVIGISGGIVQNGLMISSLFAIPLVLLSVKSNLLYRWLSIVIMILSVLAMYYTQQRMAFLLVICCLCVMVLKTFGLKKMIFSLILLMPFMFFISTPEIDYGRLNDFEHESRSLLYSKSLDWIINNVLFGGPVALGNYLEQYTGNRDPHNYFISAFAFGGIVNFIILSVIFFRIVFSAIRNVIKSLKKHTLQSDYVCTFSLVIICAFSNGLTHNTSIIYYGSQMFLFYALFVRSLQLENKNAKHIY
jgi:hypothetical protein